MKPKISVIVPVYNVEPYLKRCLDSIINQSMKEIEILVIDDGSTDKSGEICNEYAKIDDRIKVTHQKNSGLSHTRNFGLDQAQGKYVMFVDSDDYVEENFCQIPYEIAEKNCVDIVMFRYNHFIDGISYAFPKNYDVLSTEDGFKTKQEAFDIVFSITSVGVWNKLYKKELFENVVFPVGRVFEDAGTSYKLLLNANSIYYINKVLYNYTLRNNSLSKKLDSNSRKDLIILYYEMQESLKKEQINFPGDEFVTLLSLKYLILFGGNSELSYKCDKIIKDFISKNKKCKRFGRLRWFLLLLSQKNQLLFNAVCYIFRKRFIPIRF